MAAIWPAFQSQLTAFLLSNKSKSATETANKIGQLYHQAVKTAMPIMVPGATPIAGSAKIIAKGFETSFKLGEKLGQVPATPIIYGPAGAAIITYWTGKTFTPTPPPTWVSGVNVVTVPGVPPVPQIFSAFKAQSAPLVASGLVAAFSTHLLSVSGIFTGPNAGSAGAPVPFPWVGIA